MDWFLYDNDLRHEKLSTFTSVHFYIRKICKLEALKGTVTQIHR